MDANVPHRFSDEQAKAILARAIEIDAGAPMTTMDDLRAIAAEIGVSPASLQVAVQEQTTTMAVRRIVAARRAVTAVAGLGIPMGLAAGWLLSSGTGLAMLGLSGVWLVASGGLVVLEGPTATLRSFHLKNAALWAGITVGSLVSIALSDGEIALMSAWMTAAWCVRGWITSGILGSAAVVAVRRARGPESRDRDSDVATSKPADGSRWARVAKQLRDWITRPLQRSAEQVPITRRRVASA